MKILQVNCVYKKGSTGKITNDLHRGLCATGIESVVCYGRGELVKEAGVYKTCPEWYAKLNNALTRITGIMYGGCFCSTQKLISIIAKEKPDIVHLQCINGYFVNIYRLVNWLKTNHIKTVLTLHAEFMFTANCGLALECEKWRTGCGHCPRVKAETNSLFRDGTSKSWEKMKNAFCGFDDLVVVSVSPWLMERAKKSPILAEKNHTVVFNGLDTGVFHLRDTTELRKKMYCENKKVVFHVTASFSAKKGHFKGGWFICEIAKRLPEVQFFVAGPCVDSEIVPENITLLGRLTDQCELARYYSMSDVTVISSKRETFSMVAAESLCCGTPVVGFRAGGPEQIAISEYSSFCEWGDTDGLLKIIESYLDPTSFIDKELISEQAKSRYSIEKMTKIYEQIYLQLLQEGEINGQN